MARDDKTKYRAEWLLALSIPLTYLFAFAVRIGQCYALGISYDFYPVTPNDFLRYLVPVIAATIPMFVIALSARRFEHKQRYLFFITLIATGALYTLIKRNSPADGHWVQIGISVIVSLYFIGLVVVAIWPFLQKCRSAKLECMSNNWPIVAQYSLFTAVGVLPMLALAFDDLVTLSASLAVFIIVLAGQLVLYESTDSVAEDIPEGVPRQTAIVDYLLWIAMGVLFMLAIGYSGYVHTSMSTNANLLTISASGDDKDYAGESYWCVLCMPDEKTAVCTPAIEAPEGEYLAPAVSRGQIRVINISTIDCIVTANGCKKE